MTTTLEVRGSAKRPNGWMRVTDATVYYDHPVHASSTHTLNVDLRRPVDGVGARVAVELDAASARALAEAILQVLDAVPADVLAADLAAAR